MTPATIKHIRLSFGLSASDFAKALGMTGKHAKRNVLRYQSGKMKPPPEIVNKLTEMMEKANG